MTDHKFTDEEIIKALELCFTPKGTTYTCAKCPYHQLRALCKVERDRDALDLINRQKAEIEELEAECDRQYEQAEADIRANIADGGTSCHWCMDKHKAEAIKEFAERLKRDAFLPLGTYFVEEIITAKQIDNLVKEMTEGKT